MANTEAEYRKKRVEENRDTENLITEKKSDENIFEKQVFDILEYLEKESKGENNSIARKILKLKEYGITDKEIETRYKDKAGSRETIDSVSSILESVFEDLVNYINDIPNGVYIDLATAEKNDAKSFEQAIQYGIYPEDAKIKELNDSIIQQIENLGKTSSNEKIDMLFEKYKEVYIGDYNTNKEMVNDINDILMKDENDMKLSDPLKKIVKESKDVIENSPYESDVYLFEISKLQVELRAAKTGQDYNLILAKIAEFYKKHPEYVSRELPVLNKDASLNKEELKKMQEFSESYQKLVILEHIDTFNGLTPQELQKMDLSERKHMMMCAFSGLKYRDDPREEYQVLVAESMKMIKQLYPNLNLNNGKELAAFFKEHSGIDVNFESLSLQELIGIYSRQLKEATEDYLEKDTTVYKGKEIDFTKLDLDSSERKVFDSPMKNFFVGSNIDFTSKDEEDYNQLYKKVTIESWIENKENAIKLRYAALTTIRDEYKNHPVGTYTEKKLVEIERDIEIFEAKFGKVDLTEKEGDVRFDVYREDFVKAGITKYLSRDAREWCQGADYEDLTDEQKKGYIRNILVALDDSKDPNSYMTKIALRRLELMGDDFVRINSDGTYQVNEEMILEEYKKYSDYKYPSYEQLAESAKLRKNEYLLKKLEEYTNLPESSFVEIDRNDPDAAIAKIDETRYLSNQKRIEQFISKLGKKREERAKKIEENKKQTSVTKKTEKISDKDVFESVKGGTLAVEVMDTSATKINTTPQVPRDETIKNQVEESGQTGESSAVSEMKATTINTSAIVEGNGQNKNVKPSFIETIKNAFAIAKNAVSRLMKNEDKPKELGPGRKEMTEEERKAKYDETFRPVDTSQTSRTAEPIVSTPVHTQTNVRGEER